MPSIEKTESPHPVHAGRLPLFLPSGSPSDDPYLSDENHKHAGVLSLEEVELEIEAIQGTTAEYKKKMKDCEEHLKLPTI